MRGGGKASLTSNVLAGDLPRLVVFIGRDLTKETRCTMRNLRRSRRLWVCLQQEAPFVSRDATLVTIFAGGNDANTIATAIARGESSAAGANEYIDGQVQKFAADYRSLISTVRGRSSSAHLVILNLPNFAGLPFMAKRTATEKRWIERLSVGFSLSGANQFAAQGAAVVDLLCDARSYQASNYSSDGFHPNDAGYAYMAGEVLKASEAGSWPAPASSCTQMTLAP